MAQPEREECAPHCVGAEPHEKYLATFAPFKSVHIQCSIDSDQTVWSLIPEHWKYFDLGPHSSCPSSAKFCLLIPSNLSSSVFSNRRGLTERDSCSMDNVSLTPLTSNGVSPMPSTGFDEITTGRFDPVPLCGSPCPLLTQLDHSESNPGGRSAQHLLHHIGSLALDGGLQRPGQAGLYVIAKGKAAGILVVAIVVRRADLHRGWSLKGPIKRLCAQYFDHIPPVRTWWVPDPPVGGYPQASLVGSSGSQRSRVLHRDYLAHVKFTREDYERVVRRAREECEKRTEAFFVDREEGREGKVQAITGKMPWQERSHNGLKGIAILRGEEQAMPTITSASAAAPTPRKAPAEQKRDVQPKTGRLTALKHLFSRNKEQLERKR